MTTIYTAITISLLASPPMPVGGDCLCDAIKLKGGWCGHCTVGYIAGIRIESADLFEWLDAHGHDVNPDKLPCAQCRKAIAVDGFCDKCNMGYVNKEAWLSRLTYHVAKGKPRKIDDIKCDACQKNATSTGWCDKCDVGMVGNVAIKNKDDFQHARKAVHRLRAAIEKSKTCETCALAMISDMTCHCCKIDYRDGKPIPKKRR